MSSQPNQRNYQEQLIRPSKKLLFDMEKKNRLVIDEQELVTPRKKTKIGHYSDDEEKEEEREEEEEEEEDEQQSQSLKPKVVNNFEEPDWRNAEFFTTADTIKFGEFSVR
jgi:hypothetical protein